MTESGGDTRADYAYFMAIPTRWNDNDMLGHVNNVAYVRYFEAIVVRLLMEEAGVDWLNDPIVPMAVESLCRHHRPLTFPETVEAGIGIARLGTTSVTFAVALFSEGEENAAATGHFVHVFVDRESHRPVPVPEATRAALERYQ